MSRIDRAYAILTGDDDTDRACKAIPEEACRHLPRNYVYNLASGAFQKLAEQLGGPQLVLPWLMAAMGAPAAFIGWLMPIRQAGALLPQLAIAGWVRAHAIRKWFWAVPAFIAGAGLFAMAGAAVSFDPVTASWVILGLLMVYSLTRGVASVSFQDVLGKTVDKGVRGRLLANRGTLGGALAIGVGLFLSRDTGEELSVQAIGWLLAAGGVCWLLAGSLYALTREEPGATEGGRDPLGEFGAGFTIMRRYPAFQRYLVARGLLLSVEIAAPFYVLLGQDAIGTEASALGAMLTAVAVANTFGSAFWGRYVDASARSVQTWGGLLGVAAAAFAIGFTFLPEGWQQPWLFAVAFLLLGFSEAGVRLGRKTWIVDVAPEGDRATWVAFANTLIGLITLGAGLLGLIAQAFGPVVMMATLGGLALAGVIVTLMMPAEDELGV